ncbi:hypothetical protein QBC45DRAFT_447487 [Copromyces sp. CBS 386.78]|nr:hypothetical protein QBC45DRAFT_447487 [Copromyces sp. CBS 386.78]
MSVALASIEVRFNANPTLLKLARNTTIEFHYGTLPNIYVAIGEPFSFVFSKSTFTSPSTITYSLTNSPKWLLVDSGARRLYGTPKEADVGPGEVVDVPVGLVATDETGSTTLDFTLIISRKTGVELDIPLNQQIPGFGFFSNPYTILSPPRNQFSFVLDPKTFSASSDKPLAYYAVMADNTPLPAWISFDAGRLAFSGQTPAFEALIDPPQAFEVTADQTTVVINVTAGEFLSYDGLRKSINVDGQPMTSGHGLTVASTFNIPPWLTLDKDNLRMTGTPPMTAKSTNFTIALEDSFADRFNLTVMVQVRGTQAQDSSILKEDLPVIKAQAGEHISFDLGPYLEDPDGTEIAIDDNASPSWIHVREGTIFGDVPKSSKDSIVSATIRLASKTSGASEAVLLSVHMLADSGDTADTTDADSDSGSTSTEDSGGTKPGRIHAPTPIGLILLCTILPGLLLLGALMSMLICCLRRRREAKRPKLSTRDISGPLPGTFTINVTSPDGQSPMEHITGPHNTQSTIGRMSLAEQDRKSDPESGISRDHSFDGDVPRPLSTIRMLPTNEELLPASSSLLDVTGSPLMSGAITGTPRNRRHERTQTLLSHISETSYYEEHSAGITIDNTLEFLGNSNTRGSFRDGVEVDIPCLGDISSIQATPNSAYTAMLARKLVWPWFKGRVISIKGVAEKFGRAAKTTQAGLPSLSSIQASLHDKTPDTSLVSNKQSDSSGIPDFPSPPQGTKRPVMPKYERPVTRRAVGTGRIVIPRQRLVSTKVEVVGGPTEDRHKSAEDKKQASPTPSFDRPSRNSLGISYADMASNSPFHQSSTWSTIPSSHEWHDETIQSLENADSVLPSPSHRRSRSASQPNWAPYKDSLSNINDAASSKYSQSQWSFAPIPRPQPLGDASSIASQGLSNSVSGFARAPTLGSVWVPKAPSSFWLNGDAHGDGDKENKWASATRSGNPRFRPPQPIALVTSQSKTSSDFAVYI